MWTRVPEWRVGRGGGLDWLEGRECTVLRRGQQRSEHTSTGGGGGGTASAKLQALVYDILPSTTAVGSRKLSANEQFFVGAQRVVILLQATQIN